MKVGQAIQNDVILGKNFSKFRFIRNEDHEYFYLWCKVIFPCNKSGVSTQWQIRDPLNYKAGRRLVLGVALACRQQHEPRLHVQGGYFAVFVFLQRCAMADTIPIGNEADRRPASSMSQECIQDFF